MDKNAEIAAKLQALRADYAARLPAELQRLRTLANELDDPDRRFQALGQLNQKLHKLAGSAGSFGFTELGRQAKKLELQTQEWQTTQQVDAALLPVFHVAISALGGDLQAERNTKPLP